MSNYKYLFSIQYDGSNYKGWALQSDNSNTIHFQINKALKLNLNSANFRTYGASRTDAKVHALDQKMVLILKFPIKSLPNFLILLNRILPNDIYVNSIKLQNEHFHIRDYKFKKYCYTICVARKYNIFLQNYKLYLNQKISLVKLKKVLRLFCGEHNFQNYSGVKPDEKINTIKIIDSIKVKKAGNDINIIFQGHSFIRYQIRFIVGSAIAYAEGKMELEEIYALLHNDIRNVSKFRVQPNGLILQKIQY